LGSGGRYVCGTDEPATGLTLYPDAILRAAPARAARARLYVPLGLDGAAGRAAGFATVAALDPEDDAASAARRLGCSHVMTPDGPSPLGTEG
jgi:ATP phosphoribosyltransferase regulatory subunit